MLEYLLLMACCAATYPLMRLLPFQYKIRKAICIAIPLLVFLVMMTLRNYSVGADVHTYYGIFVRYQTGAERPSNKDVGFYYLMFLFSKLPGSFGFRLFLFFEYFVFCAGAFLLLFRHAKGIHVYLLILMMCPLFPLVVSGLRQGFGIGLCFYALFLVKTNWKAYVRFPLSIAVWIIACLFHFGAVSFGVYYLLRLVKPIKKYNIIVLVCLWFFACIATKYLLLAVNTFYNFGYGVGGVFQGIPKISILYFVLTIAALALHNAKGFTLPIVGEFAFPETEKRSFQEGALMSLAFCYIYTSACWNNVAPRIALVFIIGFPALAVTVIKGFKNPATRFSLNAAIVVLSVVGFYYENAITNACGTYPFAWL